MVTGMNESKILTKHMSYECKCKFNGRKYSSNQKWHHNECQWEYKNPKNVL